MALASVSRRLKTGIIGCGLISSAHAHALVTLPASEFWAVYDTDPEKAKDLAATHAVPHVFASLDDFLASGVEAVMVCAPHKAHEAIVLRAAEAGVHVLCEKPIAVELDAADRMIAAADAAGIAFGVAFMRRFWPSAQRTHDAIVTGQIGVPTMGMCQTRLWRPESYYAQAPWRGTWAGEGGGVLMNQAIHMIDLMQWFMGPVTEVYGKYATLVHGDFVDVEDTVAAAITFASGGLGIVQAMTTVEPAFGYRVTVHGSKGHTLSIWENPESIQGYNDIWTLDPSDDARARWEAEERYSPGFPHFHTLLIADFLDAVIEGRQPAITGAEGRKSLAIVRAIYESSRTGVPVRFAPLD